ncbi:MAG: hypothetical protein A3D92_03205 [Bacteroidetes bacterium RIFCSPHIGHO2_02_FULL_44_7]|nr:MAG: hypothetical protein A3D92_03205 [Bacteroidetes bacterium RIFCSPHIGHO2_02_FULL_44_7]
MWLGFSNTLAGLTISATGKASMEAILSNSPRQPFYFWTNKLGQVPALEQYNFFTHLSATALYQLPKQSQSFFAGGIINLKQTQNITFIYPNFSEGFRLNIFKLQPACSPILSG